MSCGSFKGFTMSLRLCLYFSFFSVISYHAAAFTSVAALVFPPSTQLLRSSFDRKFISKEITPTMGTCCSAHLVWSPPTPLNVFLWTVRFGVPSETSLLEGVTNPRPNYDLIAAI
jgi:hypothetical protein